MLAIKESTSVAGDLAVVNIELIKLGFCTRMHSDMTRDASLVDSILKHGLLQPVVVRLLTGDPEGYEYELVSGGRRYRAARQVGVNEISVVIYRELSDTEAQILSLVENLQRQDLNPIEETQGILQLLSVKLGLEIFQVKSLLYRMFNEATGKVTGQSTNDVVSNCALVEEVFDQLGCVGLQAFVVHRLPLLELPEDLKRAIASGLSYSKAKELNKVDDPTQRAELLQRVIDEDFSVREIASFLRKGRKQKASAGSVGGTAGGRGEKVVDEQGERSGEQGLADVTQQLITDSQIEGYSQDSGTKKDSSLNPAVSFDNTNPVELGNATKTDQTNGLIAVEEAEIGDSSVIIFDDNVNVEAVDTVVNELESFAIEIIAPKLEKPQQQRFWSLIKQLKQLVQAAA